MTTEKNGFIYNLKYLPRTICVITVLLTTTFPIAAIFYLLSFVIKNQKPFSKVIKIWANINLWIAGLKINITGLENIDKNKQYIIIANHESALDIFLGIGKIPLQIRMMSKIGIKKLPLIGGLMTRLFFIFVDRSNTKISLKNINKAMKNIIENDISLFIFPEGTRIKDIPLLPFKKGAFVLGIKHNLPILPVVMKGAKKINPPHTLWVKKQSIEMEILPSIPTDKLNLNDIEYLRDKCFNIYKNNLQKP